jgi:tetratricopeptide (TPR) repeat protein
MTWQALIAHAPGEEQLAEEIARHLADAGYAASYRGAVLVGESFTEEASKALSAGGPVILCATINAMGTGWAHLLVNSAFAQANKKRIFALRIEKLAYLDHILADTAVVEYWQDPVQGIQDLLKALRKHFPLEPEVSAATPIETPVAYLDRLTGISRFDSEALKSFRTELRAGIARNLPPYLDDLEFLQRSSLMRNGFLTLTGVLLFGDTPTHFLPSAFARFIVYSGKTKTADREPIDVRGTVIDQITGLHQQIASRIRTRERVRAESPRAEVIYEYPMRTVREIIANALVHRDYEDSKRWAHVRLFTDHIEILSPGNWVGINLLEDGSPVGLSMLVSESVKRNLALATVVAWARLIEGEGSGLLTAIEECQEISVPEPIVSFKDGYVKVTIFPRSDWEMERPFIDITGRQTSPKTTRSGPVPPRLHNLPFSSLGDLLKGRDEELRKLQDGVATAITQAETIYGLGGIGKTRLAVEHAWRSGNLYDYAFFVVAESTEALHSGLANLARPDLLNLPEYKTGAQEESVGSVLRWFREHDRWLLILDNVDTKNAEQAVMKIVPSLSMGRVLITSRIKDWPAGIRKQQIETLSLGEAQRFILERTASDRNQSRDDPGQALQLARVFDGLPLALEQAAAYIAQHQMSLHEYLEESEREREKVLSWYDNSVMQYPASVTVIWQKTFEQLGPTAATILRLTAYLASNPIPVVMFEEGAKIVKEAVGLLCEEIGAQLGDQAVSEAIAELASYSMVTRAGANFSVHRIVQDVLRSRIPEERRRDWVELSLRIVNKLAPLQGDDVRTWPVWDILQAHAVQVVAYADAIKITDPTSCLMNKLATLMLGKGLYLEAEPLMRRGFQIDEESFGPQHPNVARDLNSLAQLLQATNRLSEAEPLMRRALQIDEESFGPQHPNVARDLNNLAQLLQTTNRLLEAEPLMRRALQIDEESFGPQHPNIARDLNNLAQLLQTTNRLLEAEPLMRRALQIDEESFGPQHPNIAIRLNNLALLLQDTNRLSEAKPLMRRALQIDEESFGPQHPNVARDLNNLAQLLQATNRLAEAEPLMRRALQIDEESFGSQHPNVAIDLNNLASLLQATNRLSEAESLMRRALQIDEKSFGPQHPEVAIDLNNLASLLQATSRLSEAEPLMRRALQIDEESFGPQHPNVAIRLNNLAQLLQATHRVSDAEPLTRRALQIDEESFGPQHPNVAIRLNNLAKLLKATNRLSEAEPLMRRAVDIFKNSLGEEHPKTQIARENLDLLLEQYEFPSSPERAQA